MVELQSLAVLLDGLIQVEVARDLYECHCFPFHQFDCAYFTTEETKNLS